MSLTIFVLHLLWIPSLHALATLASHSTDCTFLVITKVAMETDIIDTDMLRAIDRLRNGAVRKVKFVDTFNLILVAEGAIIRIETGNTLSVVKDISIKATSAVVSVTLETARSTEVHAADVLGASGLVTTKDVSERNIE